MTLGSYVNATLGDGALASLVADGVIAGVGSVVVFLPQILILFLFIIFLEDSGYLARAAYLRQASRFEAAARDLAEAREIAAFGEMGLWLADCALEATRQAFGSFAPR